MFKGSYASTVDLGEALLYLVLIVAAIIIVGWLLRGRLHVTPDSDLSARVPIVTPSGVSTGISFRLAWQRRAKNPEQDKTDPGKPVAPENSSKV